MKLRTTTLAKATGAGSRRREQVGTATTVHDWSFNERTTNRIIMRQTHRKVGSLSAPQPQRSVALARFVASSRLPDALSSFRARVGSAASRRRASPHRSSSSKRRSEGVIWSTHVRRRHRVHPGRDGAQPPLDALCRRHHRKGPNSTEVYRSEVPRARVPAWPSTSTAISVSLTCPHADLFACRMLIRDPARRPHAWPRERAPAWVVPQRGAIRRSATRRLPRVSPARHPRLLRPCGALLYLCRA